MTRTVFAWALLAGLAVCAFLALVGLYVTWKLFQIAAVVVGWVSHVLQ
jgi:hypothetical protein